MNATANRFSTAHINEWWNTLNARGEIIASHYYREDAETQTRICEAGCPDGDRHEQAKWCRDHADMV